LFKRATYYLVNRASRGLIKLIRCDDRDVFVIYTNDIQVPIEEFEKSDACAIDFAVKNGWVYDLTNGFWLKGNVRFRYMRSTVFQVFNEGDYEQLDVKGKVVIDVGAYIGDSAIYFALKGARKVVAVEPLLSNYRLMLKNLDLNPELRRRVLPINVTVSGEAGYMEFRYNADVDGGASAYGSGRFTTRVRSMRLSTLIKEVSGADINLSKFKVKVLKADCKGCKYELVNDETIRLFDIVKLEYSGYLVNKTYHELMGKLEELGFRCRVWAHNELAIKIGLDRHGTMTCIKGDGAVIR